MGERGKGSGLNCRDWRTHSSSMDLLVEGVSEGEVGGI